MIESISDNCINKYTIIMSIKISLIFLFIVIINYKTVNDGKISIKQISYRT